MGYQVEKRYATLNFSISHSIQLGDPLFLKIYFFIFYFSKMGGGKKNFTIYFLLEKGDVRVLYYIVVG